MDSVADRPVAATFDEAKFDDFLALMRRHRLTPTVVPAIPFTKRPIPKFAHRRAGESDARGGSNGMLLLTGQREGATEHVIVIDVDTKEHAPGQNGFDTLNALERKWGKLPPTVTVRTPSGGQHLYFRTSADIGNTTSDNGKGIGQGVDIRGGGGLVALPGSVHKSGGVYELDNDPAYAADSFAALPPAWSDGLPRRYAKGASLAVEYVSADPTALRAKLAETVKGKKGDEWACLRRAVKGDRMFRIKGGPGSSDLPLIDGVDNFVSTQLLWTLANEDDWYTVAPDDVATLLDSSFSVLRSDVAGLGDQSKFTAEHVAAKWLPLSEKVAGDRAFEAALLEKMGVASRAAHTSPLPPVVQISGSAFYVLDDRDVLFPLYRGPYESGHVRAMAKEFWPESDRVLEIVTSKSVRPMTAIEICDRYGRGVDCVVSDYTAERPRLDDVTLHIGPGLGRPAQPKFDADVDAWLRTLAGDRFDVLSDYIAWCAQSQMEITIPCLVLVGGSRVGKTLLAHGLARAIGQRAPGKLGRALGRFGSVLCTSPVLFGDEGIPRNDQGQPRTEEFRALCGSVDHEVEIKGVDRPVYVHGAPRVILAANRLDRLFSNRGTMGEHDIAALGNRLLVINVDGDQRIAEAKRLSEALGDGETDPRRLARVAGHFAWIQANRKCDAPRPDADTVTRELRSGGDTTRTALEVLQDKFGAVTWIADDEANGRVWVRPKDWALASQTDSSALGRAIGAYVRDQTKQVKHHPVDGSRVEPKNGERWLSLRRDQLIADGYGPPLPDDEQKAA